MARSEGDEVVLIRPMPAGRVRPDVEVAERSDLLGVVFLLLWSDIWRQQTVRHCRQVGRD